MLIDNCCVEPEKTNGAALPIQVIQAYLATQVQRPGREILLATRSEQYGQTLTGLGNFTHPLIFDTTIDGADYGIAGSCFLGRYHGDLFVVTAKHCLTASNGNDVRIALNPSTKSFLPLKQLHKAESTPPNQDWADVAIFEAAPELLEAEEQKFLKAINLDRLKADELRMKQDARLVIPGFPKSLNEVDYDRLVLHTQRYMPSGKYVGPAGRLGIHAMKFDELEQIDWPDGMSGSPVFFVEEHVESHYFGLLGMLIKAHRVSLEAEFIGADVLFKMLDAIIAERGKTVCPQNGSN